jgi:hypothetical protein
VCVTCLAGAGVQVLRFWIFGVWGLGSRAWGLVFRVLGLGFKVQGLGYSV